MGEYDERAAAMWNAFMGRDPEPEKPKHYGDLIRRDDAIDKIHDFESSNLPKDVIAKIAGMYSLMYRIPAVNAADVVRCRNCALRTPHREVPSILVVCARDGIARSLDGYCEQGYKGYPIHSAGTALYSAPIVYARWDDDHHCTNCGRSCLNDYGENEYESDFCPHCGARMEEKP